MILTRKELTNFGKSMRLSIPAKVEKELLTQYGNFATDDEGNVFEFTEQDIYEQLRKKLQLYKNTAKMPVF